MRVEPARTRVIAAQAGIARSLRGFVLGVTKRLWSDSNRYRRAGYM
jgi:hypothetical protein